MSEDLKIKNEVYLKQIIDEFRRTCEEGSFELNRNYEDIKKSIEELLQKEFDVDIFKSELHKILKDINKKYWGLNFMNLGFNVSGDDANYTNEHEQWKKLYTYLKANTNSDVYKEPDKDFLYGYGSTATVTPLLHLINQEKFPVINSVYLKFIKDFFNKIIPTELSKYGTTKQEVNSIAEYIQKNYFTDDTNGVYKNLSDSELLDRLAFYYAQKQSSAVDLKHKNIIYYGPPGTGKTYSILETVNMLTEGNKSLYKMVQFHPSYSYEDFIEGIKPSGMDTNGGIKFDLIDGEFKKFCIEARNDMDNNYYFVIDEINRAELSRVFGEILFCLEYRLPEKIDKETKGLIRTPYATLLDEKLKELEEKEINKHTVYWNKDEKKSYFGIPNNVFVIGTMNDIDRSIDSFDLALRRRFRWEYMNCDINVLKNHLIKKDVCNSLNDKKTNILTTDYIEYCKALNEYISVNLNLGKSYKIGHAYFMKITDYLCNNKMITNNSLKHVWENHIAPLLFEYFRAEYDEYKAETELKKSKNKFIPKKENNDKDS